MNKFVSHWFIFYWIKITIEKVPVHIFFLQGNERSLKIFVSLIWNTCYFLSVQASLCIITCYYQAERLNSRKLNTDEALHVFYRVSTNFWTFSSLKENVRGYSYNFYLDITCLKLKLPKFKVWYLVFYFLFWQSSPEAVLYEKRQLYTQPSRSSDVSDSDCDSDGSEWHYEDDESGSDSSDNTDSDAESDSQSTIFPVCNNPPRKPKVLPVNSKTGSQSKPTSKYKKPKRMCPFCKKYFQEKLTRHVQLVHKKEKEVSNAMKLPKKERDAAFRFA